jgi:RNA 2',3'-cyclic 3'-phosphodiesterase
MPMIRAFIAIELPTEVRTALSEIQNRLRSGAGGRAGRWVRADGIHLTLQFLGDISTERLDSIGQAVNRACVGCRPFDLTVAGLGCFPNLRRPRVVWVGLHEETGQLPALQRAVEREMNLLAFPSEQRAYSPHLTLARVRPEANRAECEALARSVSEFTQAPMVHLRVTTVSVMRSDLRPGGAIYTELHRATLESA